jgi:hypothetical protein
MSFMTTSTLTHPARRRSLRWLHRGRLLWLILILGSLPVNAGAQQAPVDDAAANAALNAGVVAPPAGPVFAPFAEPGRPSRCRLPDQPPGTWAAITGPEFLTYSAGNYTSFETDVAGDSPWNLTVDPFTPCRWYRIGYDTDGRTNPRRLRNVIERSTEVSNGVRRWEPVFNGDDHGLGAFAARAIVVPSSRRVFVIEDGAGVGVLRGDLDPEGRITWRAADGRTATQQGISGQKVVQLVFAPGSDQVAYAATRPCDKPGSSPYCAGTGTATYQLWSTADGGDHWTVIGAWQPFGYAGVKLAVDPTTMGGGNGRLVVQYTRSDLTGLLGAVPPAWGVVACSGPSGDGSRWSCVSRYDTAISGSSYQAARGLYATRSPVTAGMRLWLEYPPAVGGVSNWSYSDDGGVTWRDVPTIAGVGPIARQRPAPDGGFPMVGVMLSGGGLYTESATYRWWGPGGKELELLPEPEGVLPSYYPDASRAPVVGAIVNTADGGMIVPHIMDCGVTYRCPGLEPVDRQSGDPPVPYRVQILRYAPDPSRMTERRAMPFSEGPPSSLTILSGRGSCADDPPGAHISTVAYVGDELLVSRGDPAPPGKPYTAVLHRYRPRMEGTTFTCEHMGTIEVTFPPAVYDMVRDATPNPRLQKPWGIDQAHVLPADHPRIGEMAFDPKTGRLWFFLRAGAIPGQYKMTHGNRTGLWTVALPPRTPAVQTLRAEARHEHDRLNYCTYGSEWPEGGTSSELLTLDLGRAAVWGCPVGRAAPVSMATGARMEHPCRFDAPFRGESYDGAGSNWLIDDLQFVDGDRVLMSNNRHVYLVDVATCGRKTKTFAWPTGVSQSGGVTTFLTTSMTCDALTFAERYDSGDGHQLAPGTTALWVPLVPTNTNGQLPKTPWALDWPDPDVLCPWDTKLAVPPAEVTEGEPAVVAARLVQVSNGAPAWGQRVTMTLAGRSLGTAVTDRSGVAKVVVPAKDVPSLPEAGVPATFEITAAFAGTAAYRPAGPARGSLLVRPFRPVRQPPPDVVVAPPAPAPAPPAPALLPPFAPALPPQQSPPPPSSNAPQTQAQPTQAGAQEEQRQTERQLAFQESARSDETAEEEGYAMSAVSRSPHDGSAAATMATALGMLIGFGVWVRVQVSPSRQRARARRRR